MAMTARSAPLLLALAVVALGCAALLYALLLDDDRSDPGPPSIEEPAAPRSVGAVAPPATPREPDPPVEPAPPAVTAPAAPAPAAPEPAAASPAPPAPARTGSVRGRVVGPDGLGVEGAAVAIVPVQRKAFGLLSRGAPAGEARTGPDGGFRIAAVPADDGYRVALRHERYPPLDQDQVRVSPDEEIDVGTLQLVAGAALRGHVRSIDTGPLAAVEVRVVDPLLPEAFGGRAPVTARTDAGGRFRFENLPPGKVRLEAEAADHAPGRLDVVLEPGRETGELEVVLRRGLKIEGEVVDDLGALLADAEVLALGDRHTARARTDAEGRFVLGSLVAGGVYRLVGEKTGYGPPDRSDTPLDHAAGTQGVRLVLERRAAVSGRALDAADRSPVTRFTVAWSAPGDEPGGERTLDSEDGTFRLSDLKPGRVVLEFRSPHHAPTRLDEIVLQVGEQVTGLEVLLRAGGTVCGRVVSRGAAEPLAGVLVGVTAPRRESTSVIFGGEAVNPPSFVRQTRTDAAGRFRLEHLVGEYVLKVRAEGRADLDLDPVRFPASGTLDLGDLALGFGGTITGFVGLAGGKGDPDAEVWIHAPSGHSRTARTDAGGRFVFERVPPGVYDVTLVRTGGKLAIVELIRSSAGEARKVEVREGEVSIAQF
ncbi:MAG: carboxypeptidase regulatory-like domain-containing protein [Planctomycetes bacterium]|nr:carboxypeptidase regulatory-like domain-containing protein [Planctomycetota bacterium]